MYQNAKVVALLKKGDVAGARKLATTLKMAETQSVTINDWTITYDNDVLTMSFSIVPNDSSFWVSCCLSGMSQDKDLIASTWTSQEVKATGSQEYNSLLFAHYKLPGATAITSDVIGIITNGKEESFFSFNGTFEV